MKVPMPGRARTSPSRSRSRYAFRTVFGLIASLATTCWAVGSWSPGSSSPSCKRLMDLLDQLQVGRHAGSGIELELDHMHIFH